ncbi:MAG: LON peptidase substrate-binding domain-containing protein [Alphaproteobacteria bacterium]|nr:LON peptidase substrate-binding domain-containing protein [Alphaproteobacteria bacterium]
MADSNQNAMVPVLPLRDTVVFPKMIVPLFVGREKSIKALQTVQEIGGGIVLACQKKAALEDPKDTDLYHVGTMGNILQMLRLPDGTVKVLIEGLDRVQIETFDTKGDFIKAVVKPMSEDNSKAPELEVLSRAVISEFEDYVHTSKRVSPDVIGAVHQIEDMSKLVDTIASHLTLKVEDKQSLLEAVNLSERFEKLLELMNAELAMMEIENKIKTRVKKQMEKSQKEY